MSIRELLAREYSVLIDSALQLEQERERLLTEVDRIRDGIPMLFTLDRKDNTDKATLMVDSHNLSIITKTSLRRLLELSDKADDVASECFKYHRAAQDTWNEYIHEGGSPEEYDKGETAQEAS